MVLHYHFIIKELAKKFEDKFDCLGENTEKYITFLVSIKEELYDGKTIAQELKFIDSFRSMQSSLSKLVNNLSEIYSKECRGCTEKKSSQNSILYGLKIINYIVNVTNVK